MPAPVSGALWAGAAAASIGAYGLVEPMLYRLQAHDLAVPGERRQLQVLHVSDLHFHPRDRRLARFLRSVPDRLGEPPDLVVATGDLIEGNDGIDEVVELLGGLRNGSGRFYVLGSHDYYRSPFRLGSYAKYFTERRRRVVAPHAHTGRLEGGLQAAGWTALTNSNAAVESGAGIVRLAGVDDPYLRRHSTEHLSGGGNDAYRIGLMHSPDVVSEFALAGFDLVLAGHTHGGQVRLPGIGAVVTNCSLPSALACGPQRVGAAWLHVSPGLGTGKHAPVRLLCRPEITLLRLVPRA